MSTGPMASDLMELPLHPGRHAAHSFGICYCTDTFAASNLSLRNSEARAVAGSAEQRKRDKYQILAQTQHFVPIGIETSGAYLHILIYELTELEI